MFSSNIFETILLVILCAQDFLVGFTLLSWNANFELNKSYIRGCNSLKKNIYIKICDTFQSCSQDSYNSYFYAEIDAIFIAAGLENNPSVTKMKKWRLAFSLPICCWFIAPRQTCSGIFVATETCCTHCPPAARHVCFPYFIVTRISVFGYIASLVSRICRRIHDPVFIR